MSLMILLAVWWENTKDMPRLLRMLCRGGMVATPILFAFLALPIANYHVNGHDMTYSELWLSGTGIVFTVFLGLGGIGSWGLAARHRNARWGFVFAPLVPYLLSIFFFPAALPSSQFSLSLLLEAVVGGIVIYAYLFHAPPFGNIFYESIRIDQRA